MKICPRCKKEKDLALFPKNRGRKDGRGPYCKECTKIYQKNYFQENKGKWKESNAKRLAKTKRKVNQAKSVPCTDCGKTFPPCAMDFDHKDPKTKTAEVSRLLSYGWKKVKEEIDKCDIVCACCHRIRTQKRTQGPVV